VPVSSIQAAALHGDEDALYRLHHRRLLRLVGGLVRGADEDIEDACAFAWAQFLRRQPDREMTFPWLAKVAMREAWRLGRRRRRDARLEELPEDSCVELGRETLDDAIAAREALRILASLPDRQRRYLTLKISGYSYVEIRAVTSSTYTNVNKHLCRARARIRAARAS
jgi:DNA-directed RNA polymerase specialized sigma24 family protein